MIRPYGPLLAAVAAASCTPQVRDVTYFEANPEVTAKVVADCAAGAHRGEECANARAAASSLRRDQRMDAYKKNF
ncbi:EexN family lipoprotein [Phenylobacterium sp. VNQ135]|uniref:EexN family lipoprotein n=1 Tax=Phenylobacterium sp. VNQ135 TaxID=3400922 RepID=UPI003C0EF1C6